MKHGGMLRGELIPDYFPLPLYPYILQTMEPYRPKKILVQEQSWQYPATREILERLSGIPTETVRDADPRVSGAAGFPIAGANSGDTLILMPYPGRFVKNCQGSGAEICCGYLIVSYAWNCHLECSYCVLQSYLSNEAMLVCTNIDQLVAEVKETLGRTRRVLRIGTGELADSLALDSVTHYSRRLIPAFASQPNGILELKTKTDQIANLENLDHRGRTVVSWSMNSRRVCETEERKAATFDERLAAAVRCQGWGYRLGFHFDPLIHYEGWEGEYREAVQEIFRAVDPDRVAWISLGALRFPPHLRELIQKRFPESRIPYGEFVPGHHGKLRYFRPIREEMYRKMEGWIRAAAPEVFVYLCMESGAVWERSFGRRPRNTASLSELLVIGD
jgi:spore photoproduct lyase